ncbi:MAG: hypothetical protein M3069_13135 [Chloroflexota bacterium]|nr:hypothetical protein [Chloroflexota bacterium]
MVMSAPSLVTHRYRPEYADRPGNVTEIKGVIFQSDGKSTVGRVFIRPFEALDRWIAHVLPAPDEPPLAMHAGIHVVIDGQHEFVAEQLVGSLYLDFHSGLNWTPLQKFRERDRGGWDVTVAPTNFRAVDDAAVAEARRNLNVIRGHPFLGEDCTAFVERAFSGRRLFADSPVLARLGIGVRVGDPALPLLKPDAQLDARARELLQFDEIKNLPDAQAPAGSPNGRDWLFQRGLPAVAFGATVGSLVERYSSSSRRSTPISSTARRFFK